MAGKASAGSKILVGLFVVLVFPTGALLLQRHFGAQADQDQGQKQTQTQKVEITVNNHSLAPADPRKEGGGKTEEKEGGTKTLPPSPQAKDLPSVTVEELNQEPPKFNGKTICVDAQVSGTVFRRFKNRVCLTVSGKTTTIVGDKPNKDGINFTLFDDKASLIEGWNPTLVYPVKLTILIARGPGGSWLAIVNGIKGDAGRSIEKVSIKSEPNAPPQT